MTDIGASEPAASDATARVCLNCGAAVTSKHCAECGQSAATKRLGFGELAGAAFDAVANFDTALLRTLVGLSRRPGDFAREYVDGHRTGRVSPVKWALLTAAVIATYFAAERFVEPSDFHALRSSDAMFVVAYLPVLAIPLTAPLHRLPLRPARLSVVEHAAFLLHAYAWASCVVFVAGSLVQAWTFNWVHTNYWPWRASVFLETIDASNAVVFVWLAWAGWRFARIPGRAGLLRAVLASALVWAAAWGSVQVVFQVLGPTTLTVNLTTGERTETK